ncbi:sigma 54-interacting transcriptional regulator [Abyssisolibacter fermentans]|uniref:sigma 54-interacting transcriptional regulator n=1 Tax=Abyssisolibacter fermentans TaxID=1766203 RepID=UPI0008344DC7|nr:sigma-54-dependent transcriptional regulator [Abyssisolibacter fermentans]
MKKVDEIYLEVKKLCEIQKKEFGKIKGVTTNELAKVLNIQRSNASSELNTLVNNGKLHKIKGKPVLYTIDTTEFIKNDSTNISVFDRLIGADITLKTAIKQVKAAILYPPSGLHTMLAGETGVGKTMFAELMYEYAKEIKRIKKTAPFVSFNCADYANNPQLLLSQLFGVKKGSYTGANKDKDGIVKKADGGVLLLDEIHRLPPEGQEMLFYLLDRGLYRKLGEDEHYQSANILIICATTENIDSVLLKTFVRRIPMIVKIPALREMTISERWELIEFYFKQQACHLKVSIDIHSNTVIAFLLYDCINNIGQLVSDIKLCCARAFLEYISHKQKKMFITNEYLPEYVQNGLLRYKEFEKELKDIGITDKKITITAEENDFTFLQQNDFFNIYDTLEMKMKDLKTKGFDEKDSLLILSLELDKYIKNYIYNANKGHFNDLYKVVNKEIVDMTRKFLEKSFASLNTPFNEKIVYGMSIHVSCTLERINNQKSIVNPNLDDIKNMHPLEFNMASDFVSELEKKFKVNIPEDEIGFITMFLIIDDCVDKKQTGHVGIIVAMHGESAATSIVDVANRLLGSKHAIGYNMPLNQKVTIALKNLTELVKKADEGKGVLLLVDMGSLLLLGDIIYQKTEIPIKTIEMISTPMVLEATRKSLNYSSLEEVYQGVINFSPYIGRMYSNNNNFNNNIKDHVIITACITGEGTAIKLKNILEKQLLDREDDYLFIPNILPISIYNKEDYNKKLKKIKKEKNIIAVISSVEPEDKTINYIATNDFLIGNGSKLFDELIMLDDNTVFLNSIEKVISENIDIDGKHYMNAFKKFNSILKLNGITFNQGILSGLVLHIACAIERLSKGEKLNKLQEYDMILKKYSKEYVMLEKAFVPFVELFNIDFPLGEYANVLKLIHSI